MFINLELDADTNVYVNLDNVDSIVHYSDIQEIHIKYQDETMIYSYSKEQAIHNDFVLRRLV